MMRIQIDGTNSLNKGAELMLIAVVEQIEKNIPDAEVFYNSNYPGENRFSYETPLKFKRRLPLKISRYPIALLSRIGLPYTFFSTKYPIKGLDLVLDAAGFQFSDQWNYSDERLKILERYYKKLTEEGTKLIFLPQAFGPFETENGKKAVEIINKYASTLIAREEISYDFLIKAGADKSKVSIISDFSILVKGIFPEQYLSEKGKICIIPNKKMITHTFTDRDRYVDFLEKTIRKFLQKKREVFLLNHEGKGDLVLCEILSQKFNRKIPIVSGLNAKQIKGLIGGASIVISSRYHGVASALNQAVPCLATSWNHKYEMLFKDFNLKDCILNIDEDWVINDKRIDMALDSEEKTKKILLQSKPRIIKGVEKMWKDIWASI